MSVDPFNDPDGRGRLPEEFPECPWCCGPMDESHPNCKAAGDEMAEKVERLRAALIDTNLVLNTWARKPQTAYFGAVKIPQRQIERVADTIRAILHPES